MADGVRAGMGADKHCLGASACDCGPAMRAGQTPGMSRGVLNGGQAVAPGADLAGDRQARPDNLRLSRGRSVRVYPGGLQDQAYIGIRFRDGTVWPSAKTKMPSKAPALISPDSVPAAKSARIARSPTYSPTPVALSYAVSDP